MLNFLAEIISSDPLPHVTTGDSTLKTVLNITFALIGALAFLMIVIAGFRMIISGGEPNRVAEARRQIAYSAAGLILAASAVAIVNFVLKSAG